MAKKRSWLLVQLLPKKLQELYHDDIRALMKASAGDSDFGLKRLHQLNMKWCKQHKIKKLKGGGYEKEEAK